MVEGSPTSSLSTFRYCNCDENGRAQYAFTERGRMTELYIGLPAFAVRRCCCQHVRCELSRDCIYGLLCGIHVITFIFVVALSAGKFTILGLGSTGRFVFVFVPTGASFSLFYYFNFITNRVVLTAQRRARIKD